MAVQKLAYVGDASAYFAWDESDPSGASVRMSIFLESKGILCINGRTCRPGQTR